VSGWLGWFGDWSVSISVLLGIVAALLTVAFAAVPEIKNYKSSLSFVRTRTTKHLKRNKFSYSSVAALLALGGGACTGVIILDARNGAKIEPATATKLKTPKVDPQTRSAHEAGSLPEPQPNMALPFAMTVPLTGKQSSDFPFVLPQPPSEPIAGPIPVPRRRFVNPCALNEPDDDNGEFPLADYNACLAYLKKHPPKTGIGGPGAPPLPRPRPPFELMAPPPISEYLTVR
jgi:hypothetical protein